MSIRGLREWLPAFPFLPIPMPVKYLFPFPLFSHADIPIPFHSHYRLPYFNEQLMEIVTALSFMSHSNDSTIALSIQIHDNF